MLGFACLCRAALLIHFWNQIRMVVLEPNQYSKKLRDFLREQRLVRNHLLTNKSNDNKKPQPKQTKNHNKTNKQKNPNIKTPENAPSSASRKISSG